MSGKLVLADDRGGQRHFLEDRAVHAGDGVELQLPDGWLPGRYEWSFDDQPPELVVAVAGTKENAIVRLPPSATLRWPKDLAPATR